MPDTGHQVRFIAAIDDKRGIAKKQKIPWHIPTDQKYFKDKLATGPVVMGYKTYVSNGRKPYGDFQNTVLSKQQFAADDVKIANDLNAYFDDLDQDVWVAGGGQIFKAALPYATELYITRVKGDYGCDVFFPEYEESFHAESVGPWQVENGYEYRFEVWTPNPR